MVTDVRRLLGGVNDADESYSLTVGDMAPGEGDGVKSITDGSVIDIGGPLTSMP